MDAVDEWVPHHRVRSSMLVLPTERRDSDLSRWLDWVI